ncbi:hypothetical protein NX774_11225 [Massilia agilis]|uniref:Restriction endonuclease n=1 Tax=Massilia agilis TaxID=1811226 RepID=A0ABT2DDI3_9BURK|nr:hypothetical protein [Massilia agilis]MCS0808491.1 hypothetical protein [Massilia agilis]
MPHPYDSLAEHLRNALDELQRLQLGASLSKGRVGEILLAHFLGHRLHVSNRGADGIGPDGRKYEYKVSHDDQFNFNFGHARGAGSIPDLVNTHFDGFEGAFCALMNGSRLTKVVYCPCTTLVPYLRAHLATVTGSTFQKVFSPIESFSKLQGAQWLLRAPVNANVAQPVVQADLTASDETAA